MANEIVVTAGIRVRNGNLKAAINPGNLQVTQTVARGPAPGFVSVGLTEQVISFAQLATLGWCHIQNLSAANFILFGPESGGAMVAAIKIGPGEVALFRLVPGTTYRAQADTAACGVVFTGFNA